MADDDGKKFVDDYVARYIDSGDAERSAQRAQLFQRRLRAWIAREFGKTKTMDVLMGLSFAQAELLVAWGRESFLPVEGMVEIATAYTKVVADKVRADLTAARGLQ